MLFFVFLFFVLLITYHSKFSLLLLKPFHKLISFSSHVFQFKLNPLLFAHDRKSFRFWSWKRYRNLFEKFRRKVHCHRVLHFLFHIKVVFSKNLMSLIEVVNEHDKVVFVWESFLIESKRKTFSIFIQLYLQILIESQLGRRM